MNFLADPWYLSLLAAMLLCLTNRARLRTWSALMVASLLGWFLPPLSIAAYIVVDTLAAALVLRRPAGLAQRAIGLLFAGMIIFHAGFAVSSQQGWEMYYAAQTVIGWLQLACLTGWGLYDGLVAVFGRSGRREVDYRARL